MPYDLLEQKFHSLPAQSFAEVSDFFDYILYKFSVKTPAAEEKTFERKVGGYEDGFYMAPDFDETPISTFFSIAKKAHPHSDGAKWTKDEIYER